ncbi:MAG: phosphotransferase [Bacteroidota bacterium]
MSIQPRQIQSVALLKDAQELQSQFGPCTDLTIEPMETDGFSGAEFFRITLLHSDGRETNLILKEVQLSEDWFSFRTGDTLGREAALLHVPELESIFKIFYLPYHLVGTKASKIGLLMEDVSDGLFPTERIELDPRDQDDMLNKLAELHARYWESPIMDGLPWLHQMEDFVYIMGPLDHLNYRGHWAKGLPQMVKEGWEVAMTLLPSHLQNRFLMSASAITRPWDDLPHTLVHGDPKIANFAKGTDGRLGLLDWAFAGHAPCTVDIGWFLAVNASRLADSKEAVLLKYRSMLEGHLGYPLDEELWQRLEQAGVVTGAFMLLWSKAQGVKTGRAGATKEWEWWIHRLEAWSISR